MLVQGRRLWMGRDDGPPYPNDAVPKTSVGKFDKKVLRERDKTLDGRGRRHAPGGVSWG